MNIDLTGKVALVTGASGGIGRGVAIELARQGAKVAVNYLSSVQGAEETVAAIQAIGGEAVAIRADVTDVAQINDMVAQVEKAFGAPIDILVNNAGHLVQRLANAEMTEELYNKIMDVNMKSTVFVSKAVIPGMKKLGGGRIVNLTSIAAHNGGGPGASIYAASKAAVLSYSKGLAKELAGDGILVNAISPGFIGGTAFHATFTPDAARQATIQGIPLKREGTPEDVAGAVLYLVSELSAYLTGETIEINGGMFMR
ncbi:SDR family NAD(P)-dependent oxidoreductase [Paenibacillus soyae]|uniref:3-oxoacyl-ACP reductase FabG n=1 Tax=Paenibacillus soyae TaxID=2969249 RepID=A0A9X2MMZ5_9BACL|nr:3-oxoacyl-ACP reductase family protein [Paenibacillus soyae]MCR2802698.1 3-oxoacyl-ACP reductase FabG [Paenibacillus soyae]